MIFGACKLARHANRLLIVLSVDSNLNSINGFRWYRIKIWSVCQCQTIDGGFGGTSSISQTLNTLERMGVHLINSEPVLRILHCSVPQYVCVPCSHVGHCSMSTTSNFQPANKYSIYRAIPIYNHDVRRTGVNSAMISPQACVFIIIIFHEVIKLIFLMGFNH